MPNHEAHQTQRLLIVDDERSIRVTFHDILTSQGYAVDVAADVESALALLEAHTFDAILLDIVLPRVNGIMLLERIKAYDPGVPVVMITGDPHLATATEALRLGAYDYLQKPINRRTLLHVVRRAVATRHLLAEKQALERQLAQRLEASELAFDQVVEHSADLIFALQRTGAFMVSATSLQHHLGYAREHWQDVQALLRACHPDDVEVMQQAIQRAFEGQPVYDIELRVRRLDGTWQWESLVLYPVLSGHSIGGIMRDITARKRMEQEIRHADRLALLGQLASGLAHEIGTPLNIIAGNAELIRMDVKEQGLPTAELDAIIEHVDRITRLIDKFLTLARAQELPRLPLALHEPVLDALRLLETRFSREAITVEVDMPADLPLVLGAADQLQQVFLNIFVNAWHAMPHGGAVTITAQACPERQVQWCCSDTGVGMDAAHLARACEQ